MKAYVKKNLVQTGTREITKPMRDLEGTIIDVVWIAGDDGGIPGWRRESTPSWYWDIDWLMILPDGYDLATATGEIIWWYSLYKSVSEKWSTRAGEDAVKISKLEKEIRDLTLFNDGLHDTLAQKDSVLMNIQDRIEYHYSDYRHLT